MSYWIIIYPSGNRSQMCLAEICHGMEYEEGDYDRASRQRFDLRSDAVDYGRELAEEHGKEWVEGNSSGLLD